MAIHIDRPILNRTAPQEKQIADLYRWADDTADKLNIYLAQVEKVLREEEDDGN